MFIIDDTCRLFALVGLELTVHREIDFEELRPACTITISAMASVSNMTATSVSATFDVAIGDINEPCVVGVTAVGAAQGDEASQTVAFVSIWDPDAGQV